MKINPKKGGLEIKRMVRNNPATLNDLFLYITEVHYLIVLSQRIDDIVLLILIWLLQDILKNQNPHWSLTFIRIILIFWSMGLVNERCLYIEWYSCSQFHTIFKKLFKFEMYMKKCWHLYLNCSSKITSQFSWIIQCTL